MTLTIVINEGLVDAVINDENKPVEYNVIDFDMIEGGDIEDIRVIANALNCDGYLSEAYAGTLAKCIDLVNEADNSDELPTVNYN